MAPEADSTCRVPRGLGNHTFQELHELPREELYDLINQIRVSMNSELLFEHIEALRYKDLLERDERDQTQAAEMMEHTRSVRAMTRTIVLMTGVMTLFTAINLVVFLVQMRLR